MFLTKENLLKLARAYSQLPILAEVAQKKAEIDALQTVISEEQRARLNQKIRLDWNFHSNCIEGNSLTLGQTTAFIMYGLTASGKPFKDYIDIKNHNELLNWVIQWSKDSNNVLSETAIRDMHTLLMGENFTMQVHTSQGQINKTYQSGAYKTQTNQTITVTGETHYYATAEDTPYLMAELLAFYHDAINSSDINTLVVAALFHYQFVSIHPFPDGNGRLVRLLMNLILMQQKYQPVIVRSNPEQKTAYFTALQKAHTEEYETFINLIAEYELAACDLFIKAAHNQSIEDPDDIEREFALLEQSLKTQEDYIAKTFSVENAKNVYNTFIIKALECLRDFQKKRIPLFMELGFGINVWNNLMSNELAFDSICLDDGDIRNNPTCIFQFRKYKHATNSFGFDLIVDLNFQETHFIFSMAIENLKPFYSSKHKYADTFTNTIIDNIYQAAGKAIINTIKSLLENPNYIKEQYDLENYKEDDLPF